MKQYLIDTKIKGSISLDDPAIESRYIDYQLDEGENADFPFWALSTCDFGILDDTELCEESNQKIARIEGIYKFAVYANNDKEALALANEEFNAHRKGSAINCEDLSNPEQEPFSDGAKYHINKESDFSPEDFRQYIEACLYSKRWSAREREEDGEWMLKVGTLPEVFMLNRLSLKDTNCTLAEYLNGKTKLELADDFADIYYFEMKEEG